MGPATEHVDSKGPSSIDPAEIAQFNRLGEKWWSSSGPMRPLHKFNPVRVDYLRDLLCRHFPTPEGPRDRKAAAPLKGLSILDIGCGGGLLSEPLAALGAQMTSIDPAPMNIEVARAHAARSGLTIDYRCVAAEDLVGEGVVFDVVLAMEVIEHVADLDGFLGTAAAMARPGGLLVTATLNRTLKSFALAIVGAEYVLRWLPKGTHKWEKFVRPDELIPLLKRNGLQIYDETGIVFDPLRDKWRLSHDMDVNYVVAARKRA
jgi:2-polyprenyl-6-hydroxyphenyl methylase/3-demethylubiquinone-9 3-methyltransferase